MAALRIPDMLSGMSRMAAAIHPDYEDAKKASEEWLRSYNIASPQVLDKFFAQDFGLACARAWPLADKESLRLIIDWFTLLFSYDDLLDDSSTGLMTDQGGTADFSKILITAIRDEDFTPTERLPVATAYRDFMTRFRAVSTPGTQKRFINSVISYTHGAEKQNGLRERNIHPQTDEFITIRRDTGAVKTVFALTELTSNLNLPDKVFEDPIIKGLCDAANDIACLVNEVISFNREQANGDHFNLVAIIAIRKEIPVQVAIEYVFLMIEAVVARFFALKARIPKFDPETDTHVAKYIESIEYITTGLTVWSLESTRYLGARENDTIRSVKPSVSVKLRPIEPYAPQTCQQLRYTVEV